MKSIKHKSDCSLEFRDVRMLNKALIFKLEATQEPESFSNACPKCNIFTASTYVR